MKIKSNKLMKRLMVLFVVLAITAMFSMQAFASVWTFGTSGSGSNPFSPRGYSIIENGSAKWLDSENFDHDGAIAGSQASILYSPGFNETNETDEVEPGTYTIRAWFDKNPQGSSFPQSISSQTSYKDFLVVDIDGAGYVPINTLDASYSVNIANASRSNAVKDPDDNGNQWHVDISMVLKEGEEYTFAFRQGVQANNGNTLVLYVDTINGVAGVAGYVSSNNNDHLSYYLEHANELYVYPLRGSSIGTNDEGYTFYSYTEIPFEHSVTAVS